MSTEDKAAVNDDDPTAADIREEIEQTRDELGDTVEALASKADVKAQAQARVDDVKGNVAEIKDNAAQKVRDFSTRAQDATPESAASGAQAVQAKVAANPLPYAVGAAVVIGYLLGRRLSR